MSVDQAIALTAITLTAATVNGALGYGFSTITVPLALLFLTSRVLNPALALIEVVLNTWVLWINRASIPAVWARVAPIALGLAPGVGVGACLVSRVPPAWLKLGTFAVLLPLVLLQSAGRRRPVASGRRAGLLGGGAIGALYSATTISGPPLAAMLNSQGLAKRDFRAALALLRLAEASFTACAYGWMGLFTADSVRLLPHILPSIAIGIPVGAWLIRRIPTATFRRLCISFDAWIVAFGLSRSLGELHLVDGGAAYLVLAVAATFDTWRSYRFFSARSSPPVAREPLRAAI